MITKTSLEFMAEILEATAQSHLDMTLPNREDVVEMLNSIDGGSRTFDPGASSITFNAGKLAEHFAALCEAEAYTLEESAAKALSIDALLPMFDADIDAIRKRWIGYAMKPDGKQDDVKASNVIIAAFVTLMKFALLAQKLARPAFDRNGWRQVEKSIEDTVNAWMAREADGQPGLRLVKGGR